MVVKKRDRKIIQITVLTDNSLLALCDDSKIYSRSSDGRRWYWQEFNVDAVVYDDLRETLPSPPETKSYGSESTL